MHHSRNGFLTKHGYQQVDMFAQRTSLEGLASRDDIEYVDSRVSVSGLRRDEDLSEDLLEEQYQRFLNGS